MFATVGPRRIIQSPTRPREMRTRCCLIEEEMRPIIVVWPNLGSSVPGPRGLGLTHLPFGTSARARPPPSTIDRIANRTPSFMRRREWAIYLIICSGISGFVELIARIPGRGFCPFGAKVNVAGIDATESICWALPEGRRSLLGAVFRLDLHPCSRSRARSHSRSAVGWDTNRTRPDAPLKHQWKEAPPCVAVPSVAPGRIQPVANTPAFSLASLALFGLTMIPDVLDP